MKKKLKIASTACFGGSVISLAVGSSFHGLRVQQDDPQLFNLGVTMGIVMLCISTICITAGIILLVIRKNYSDK